MLEHFIQQDACKGRTLRASRYNTTAGQNKPWAMAITAQASWAHMQLQPKYEDGDRIFNFLGFVYELKNVSVVIEFLFISQCSKRVTPPIHCDFILKHAWIAVRRADDRLTAASHGPAQACSQASICGLLILLQNL